VIPLQLHKEVNVVQKYTNLRQNNMLMQMLMQHNCREIGVANSTIVLHKYVESKLEGINSA